MKIDISEPTATFRSHFELPTNKRILFSGNFGIGKSYFLKHYFEINNDSINTFFLSPVKYSVSLNEDILEYIKFDLALKLVAMPEFAPSLKIKFTEDQYIYQFFSNQPSLAVDTLFSAIEAMAVASDSTEAKSIALFSKAKPVAEKLLANFKKYKEFKAKIDAANKSTSEIFQGYLNESVLKKGSIFEDDLITQTIRSALEICKVHSGKQNVLVIDDFDRLDPEHVFRILNILSVHNDMYDEANKFGFDKIIIVCDYDNIEKIYAHKYGAKTSFLGYISKFYSTEVFYFTNNDAIRFYCRTELHSTLNDRNSQDVLGFLLAHFVNKRLLTVRDIVKVSIPSDFKNFDFGPYPIWNEPGEFIGYDRKRFENDNFIEDAATEIYFGSDDLPFMKAMWLLIIIFGGTSILVEKISSIWVQGETATEDEITYYPLDMVPKIIKAFLLLSHIAKNHSQPGFLTFSFKGETNKHYLTLGHPISSLFGVSFTIPTGWNMLNRYDGTVSYYKNVTINLERETKFNNLENKFVRTHQAILNELLIIINFLDTSNTLNKMGLTRPRT